VIFGDLIDNEEPALNVFEHCHEIVFAGSDGNTEFLERISPEARMVYLLWCFDGEVHNGGFDQFFFNSLGDHCSEILDGLRKIKANNSLSLLEKAIGWFPDSNPSKDREERWKQLEPYEDNEQYETALDNLDTEFYQYEDNLSELLHNYVKKNGLVKIEA
jgi:hypothetical protein